MQPPAPYYPPSQKYVNSGIPAPRPPDVLETPTPTSTPTATPTPLPQVKIDGVRTDRVPTPGQLLFDKTRDIAFDGSAQLVGDDFQKASPADRLLQGPAV